MWLGVFLFYFYLQHYNIIYNVHFFCRKYPLKLWLFSSTALVCLLLCLGPGFSSFPLWSCTFLSVPEFHFPRLYIIYRPCYLCTVKVWWFFYATDGFCKGLMIPVRIWWVLLDSMMDPALFWWDPPARARWAM